MFTPFNNDDLDNLAAQNLAVVHQSSNEIPNYARGYTTNNVYPGFPPLMNDGRALIASWQPEATANESLLKSSGVSSNWEYRKYLTHNAKSIIETNFAEAANDCGYKNPTYNVSPVYTGPLKNYASYIETEKDYGKFESDLKANYLTREQLAARTATPVVTQHELFELSKSQ